MQQLITHSNKNTGCFKNVYKKLKNISQLRTLLLKTSKKQWAAKPQVIKTHKLLSYYCLPRH